MDLGLVALALLLVPFAAKCSEGRLEDSDVAILKKMGKRNPTKTVVNCFLFFLSYCFDIALHRCECLKKLETRKKNNRY